MNEEMKIQFRQPSIGWCSVYMLANLLRDEEFLKYTDDPKFKGCTDEDLNFMLDSLRTGLKLSPIAFSNQVYGYLPNDFIYNNILTYLEPPVEGIKIQITPYILTVSLIPGVCHHVAVLVCDRKLFYIDPYNSHIIQINSLEDFKNQFIGCYSVDRFEVKSNSKYAVLFGERMGYQFLINTYEPVAN